MTVRIGEIVETHSLGFTGESFELHRPPALGSLVKIADDGLELYAVVSYGQTAGLEPGRRAIRRGTDDVHDAAIYDEHPELRRTLRTVFQALFVGYCEGGLVRQQLPPQPPPLHYSALQCEPDEISRFSERLYYLRLLLAANTEVPVAQLLTAHLSETFRRRARDIVWLQDAARELAVLLKNDNQTLMSILYAVDPGE